MPRGAQLLHRELMCPGGAGRTKGGQGGIVVSFTNYKFYVYLEGRERNSLIVLLCVFLFRVCGFSWINDSGLCIFMDY